jgi:DNA polymerase III epsilon subunit-like protein
MKYISIDLETTGLDPQNCQILQIGAVIEDTNEVKPISELPKFNCVIEHPHYSGSAFAINMNMNLIEIIAGMEKIPREERGEYRKKHNI